MNLFQMAQETIKLSETMAGKLCFEDDTPPISESLYEPEISSPKAPETSGIIFRIDKGGGTYCIRGLATSSIAESLKLVNDFDSEVCRVLKISDVDQEKDVHFFKTDSIEMAEVIQDHIFNRRFPYNEDSLCNLSDPGFSWWMKNNESGIKIYFRSYGVNRVDELIQLGPIGDSVIASLRFIQAKDILSNFLDIKKFECSEKQFEIEVTDKSTNFLLFKNIFLAGDDSVEITNDISDPKFQTINLFFKEIANIRRFWLQIEELL